MRRTFRVVDGEVREVHREGPGAHNIMIDAYGKNPTWSPVDGSLISSRAELREHNRRNGVEDIGNDGAGKRPGNRPMSRPQKEIEHSLNTLYQRYEQNDPAALASARAGRGISEEARRVYGWD